MLETTWVSGTAAIAALNRGRLSLLCILLLSQTLAPMHTAALHGKPCSLSGPPVSRLPQGGR